MSSRVCAIVGAGPGLGAALAETFAKAGYAIALLTRSASTAEEARTRVTAAGQAAFHAPCDASKPDSVKQAFDQIRTNLGPPSVLIYNAAPNPMSTRKSSLELSEAEVTAALQLGALGALYASQAVIPDMIKLGGGTIIATGATAQVRGSSHFAAFAMAKFALKGLCQSLAREHSKEGIHVVNVRIDAVLDTPDIRAYLGARYEPSELAEPAAIASTYLALAQQPRSAWSNEIDIRPFKENWTV